MRLGFGWPVAVAATLMISATAARAADPPAHPTFWVEEAIGQLEAEAMSDLAAAPAIPAALEREWRSFDRQGSVLRALGDLGWIAAVTIVALLAQRGVARVLSHRPRRRMRARTEGPHLIDLLGLLACDIGGLAVFLAVFMAAQRHWLSETGVTTGLAILAASVLLRWRVVALIVGAVLRPDDPVARLVEISDREARRLGRFLSITVLVIIALVGFGRYGLMDEDSGAAHVIGLINAVLVCGLYVMIVFRARAATEALIHGRRRHGVLAAIRAGMARAWVAVALALVAGLMVFFAAGLSLGMLSYYHAVTSTLGILFVLLVLDRLTERVWHDPDPGISTRPVGVDALGTRTVHHIVRAFGLALAMLALAWIWIDAADSSGVMVEPMMRSAIGAVGTLFVAFVVWELVRLAIDRHLQDAGDGGPALPGDDDDAAAPASRLQTILPLVRAAFGILIGVLASLIVLSRLGVDTAPLIAGAGVFGLAVSFGSQSLVRDIISGLFYMWDDAFRVGEYIDTGRLKGTVETLGIRSVKLRHQNGPLHTIPYGQLGAVSNLSRDFATIKFNLRFETGTDVELVRKTAKQIGIAMQDDPEMAAEIMLPLKLQGIAEVVDSAVVLRFKFTARPVKPSWVQREYLKRMVKVFAEKGIRFASGATMVLQALPAPESQGPGGSTASAAAAPAVAEAAAIVDMVPVANPQPTAAE
jgi:small-conductance mechanosensitive channel